ATVTISISASGNNCPSEFGLSPDALASLDAGGTIIAEVLSFVSTTSAPSATITNITQSSQVWRAMYDASALAALATVIYPPLPGAFACTYSPSPPSTDLKGLYQLAGVPAPVISGPSGCVWTAGNQYSGNIGNCVASSFTFGTTSGSFPQPRPASVISTFSETRSGQQLTASWSAASNPDDTVTVTAGSHYSSPGPLGTGGQYYSAQSSCRVSPLASPFVFPPSDAAQALGYAIPDPATMTLTDINYTAYPGGPPTDLVAPPYPANPSADVVVLLIYNSTTAAATVQ
ncbi:MAG TPA: hypothetical protein VL523_13050, partial [Terriglobia bacterium]|nr:hypothetical protein [Terriglobia bacterium]